MPTLAFDLDAMDEDDEEEEMELLPEDENADDLYDERCDDEEDDLCPMCKTVIEDGYQCPVCGFIVGV